MVKSITLALVAALAIAAASAATAAEPLKVTWVDLLPEDRPYHDPFAALEYSQISDLAQLFRIEALGSEETAEANSAKAKEIRERLASQGLDPDWLFEQRVIVMNQRRLAATEPNPELLGKNVSIPGYLLPLEMVDQKVVEFLLVPTVGACIHTPPPPANQMVLVRYPNGFEVDGLYTPVLISGEMRAQRQTQALQLVDGQADIETTYLVDALTVEAFE